MKPSAKLITAAAAAALLLAGCSASTDSSDAASAAGSAASAASSAASSAMASASEAVESAASDMASAGGDIVATASSAPELATLVSAVGAAGLVETLQGDGPFTVFAPTNDAFAALPDGVVDKLLKPENKDALTKILTYHVLSGEVPAADVKDGKAKTVEGSEIKLSTKDGVTVNGAKVIKADIMTSNGVVHEIDAVLLPPGFDPADLK